MRLTKNFILQEFVPEVIFKGYGERAQWFIDPRIVELAQEIRFRYDKPVIVNNWHVGGNHHNRGYRTPHTTVGAEYSQHKRGVALDFSIRGISSREIFEDVLENQDLFMSLGVTTIEHYSFTTSWTHLDMRWTGVDNIRVVTP